MTPQMFVLISAKNNTAGGFNQVVTDAKRVGQTVADQGRIAGAGMDHAAGQVGNLASQFNDIGVMLASGQSPLILAIQQGTQISQVIGPMGAAGAAKALGSAFMAMISPVSLLTIGTIAATAAAVQWAMGLGEGTDEASKSLADMAAPLDTVRSKIGELRQITDAYAEAVKDGAAGHRSATNSIIADSEREFNAKQSLLQLELKRQKAALEASRAELAMKGESLKKEVAQGTLGAGVANDVMGGFSDPKIGQFVRSPAQDTLLQRTSELIANSPLNDQMQELRANIELADIATSGLEEALGLTFSEGVAESVADLASKTKSAKENFGDFLELVDEGQAVFESTRTPLEILGAELGRLDQLLAMGVISWDTYHRAVNRATMGAASDTLGSLGQITSALAGAFEDNKALAVANAVVNTAQGITKALAEGGPFGFPIAAAIGVAGAAQVATILSAQPGSSSVASVSGGGASASGGSAAAAPQAVQNSVNVTLNGQSYGRDQIRDLLDQIGEAMGDGFRLKVS